jgi:hypothetical protein
MGAETMNDLFLGFDALVLARVQFAFTVAFHFLFSTVIGDAFPKLSSTSTVNC